MHAALEPIRRAAGHDPAIDPPRGRAAAAAWARREVRAMPYRRDALLERMTAGRIALFDDFPAGPRRAPSRASDVAAHVVRAMPGDARARVQLGPARARASIPIPELARRWEGDRAATSTTDLHFRGTSLVRSLRAQAISDFNLLAAPSADWMEMMTLVLSTTGNVTESHSDDCDGSNHCVMGSKLWLTWDRLEGRALGLEDVTYDTVHTAASFDLARFMRLESARWLVVSPGRTLFLPGHLTHRVITLEQYFGLGSFYIALPCWPRTFARWRTTGASYVTPAVMERIVGRIVRRSARIARSGAARAQYGWDHGARAVARAARSMPRPVRDDPAYRAFASLFEQR